MFISKTAVLFFMFRSLVGLSDSDIRLRSFMDPKRALEKGAVVDAEEDKRLSLATDNARPFCC